MQEREKEPGKRFYGFEAGLKGRARRGRLDAGVLSRPFAKGAKGQGAEGSCPQTPLTLLRQLVFDFNNESA